MYNIISTGSHGNCIIYHKSIMVDIGVSYSMIKPYLYDIQIVVTTHAHLDHININTLKRLAFERPSLRIFCGEWMLPYMTGFKNVDVCEIGKVYDYGSFKLSPIKAFHDIPNIGVRIYKDGIKYLHITDTSTLSGISAPNYDGYFIESNYSADTIWDEIREQEEKGLFSYKRGAMNSHLSDDQANDFFYKNKGEHSVMVRLHESKSF